ncbi:hypothetical protein ACVWYF_002673 [Hymenobacter sp. UYAg731]
MEQTGGWLVTALIFAVQLAFFYTMGRLFYLGRPVFNPFKKGLSDLRADFGIDAPPPGMQSTSAMIGSVTYKHTLYIKLDAEGMCLGKNFLGKRYVYIPYHAIRITTPPRRVTILRIPFVLDGAFAVNGVDISLKTDQAKALIEAIAYAEGDSTPELLKPAGPARPTSRPVSG